LPGSGVTRSWVSSRDTSESVTPPSSLLRAHAPVHLPPRVFSLGLYARSLTGCCQPLLADGPSRHYPHNPYRDDWTPAPRCPFSARARFFLKGIGHHLGLTRSAHRVLPALQLQHGPHFRAAVIPLCSVSSVRLAPRLLPPHLSRDGRPGRIHHASIMGYPS
jgi:hypothetical protein